MTRVRILGGGWCTADGYGTIADGLPAPPDARTPMIPTSREIFPKPLARYGRFDEFTKLGCAATALALREAGIAQSEEKRAVGFILSSAYECYTTDLRYYDTTLEEGGLYTSPNLFSYTLPGVVLGECAVYFKLTGPTFVVGENRENGAFAKSPDEKRKTDHQENHRDTPGPRRFGVSALAAAALHLEAGSADTMLVGWIDSPPAIPNGASDAPGGALVVVLRRVCEHAPVSGPEGIEGGEGGMDTSRSIPIERLSGLDLIDLFRLEE
jgi:hypothetical protein